MRSRTIALAAVLLLPVTALVAAPPGPGVAAPPGAVAPPAAPPAQVDAALQRDLGLTAAQVRARLAVEASAPETERRLRAELGSRFGGVWLAADGRLTVGVTDASAATAVRAAGATPQLVKRSEAGLDRVKAALDAASAAAPDQVTGWYVDLPGNSVVVLAQPDRLDAAQPFVSAAGVAGQVRVAASKDQPRPFFDLRGGDAYFIGSSRCSVGFSVQGGFVTAGHCNRLTSGALTGANGVALGTWGGAAFPGDDHAWVRTNANWTPLPEVAGLGPVRGSQEAVVNSSVCRNGSTTGIRCGTIVAKNQTVNYPQGTVFGLTSTSACAEPGDSGGPFMVNDQAQGVLSGGSGNCTIGGTTFYQPLPEILSTYGLTLLTQGASGGWGEVPGGGGTPSGPTAVTYNGSEYVFVRGFGDGIFVNRLTGTTWSGWSELPGGGRTPDAPAAAVYGGVLHLFVRGLGNALHVNRFDGVNWSGWSEVPGGGATPSAPAATVYGGTLNLIVRGFGDGIHINRFNGSTWTGWGLLPGGGLTPDAPAATVFGNLLQVFVRGVDNGLHVNRFDGVNWSGWSGVPGGGSTPSGPGAAVFNGSLQLFVRGFGDGIHVNKFNGSTWTGWGLVPGNGATPDAPDANVYNGTLDLFVRGTGSGIHINRLTS